MTTSPYDQFMKSAASAPPQFQSVTAWESIPKFIRFAIWFYAIASVVGLALWLIAMLALVAA